jgi:hypothetical protein
MKSVINLIYICILVIFVSLIANYRFVIAQGNYLLNDDFSNFNINNWESYSPYGSWIVQNNEYVGTASPGPSGQQIVHYSITGDKSWQNYRFSLKVKSEIGVDKVIFFRWNENKATYSIDLRSFYPNNGNDIQLNKALNIFNGPYFLLKEVDYPNNVNEWYLITVDTENVFDGVKINVYIDGQHLFEYIDPLGNSPILNGAVGVGIWPQGTQTIHFDDITVSNLPSLPTLPPSTQPPNPTNAPTSTPLLLKVPNIKQNSPPWKLLEYDHASLWTNNPTIERWGCALTSATMILQYYNINTDPKSLNDWLKTQQDGYLDNGLINWLAVSRFSKISSNNKLSLEYRRLPFSYTKLDEEFQSIPPRPSIIKLLGHFIVAIGKNSLDYDIIDPASEKNLLSLFNTPLTINQFKPSQTDLSYILFTIDSKYNLIITDTNGNNLSNYIFNEDPIIDDINGSALNTNNLTTFMFPSPPDGLYKVKISGPLSQYNAKVFLYDVDGNLTYQKLTDYINTNQYDLVSINFNETPTANKNINIDTIIDNLKNGYALKLFRNHLPYFSIKSQLHLAKELINKRKYKQLRTVLTNINFQLKFYTPRYISRDFSAIMQKDLAFLLGLY